MNEQLLETAAESATDISNAINQVSNQYSLLIEKFAKEFPAKALVFGIKVIVAILVFVIGQKLLKVLIQMTERALRRTSLEITIRKFVCNLAKAVGNVVLFFLILGVAGIEASVFATVISSVTVAIGLAVQGTLSNFAGGVMIMMTRPFKVGDFIIEDTNKNEGTVHSIGIVYTKLQTVDNRMVVIPNGTLANSSMVNVTALGKRRLDLTVGISYDADLKKAKEILDGLMEKDVSVLQNEENLSYVSSLDDSAVTMGISCWVNATDYLNTKRRMTEAIKLAFDANDIPIPFNQMDVHIKQ